MALDLETLRTEILSHLNATGISVFHAAHRAMDAMNQTFWDVDDYPDYRAFVAVAQQAGAKMIQFYHQTLSVEQIDEALDELEDSEFTREEKRQYETRLRQFREYEGFTCAIELAFALANRVYVFELQTEWYESLNEVLSELEAFDEEEEDADDGLGGYFSNN